MRKLTCKAPCVRSRVRSRVCASSLAGAYFMHRVPAKGEMAGGVYVDYSSSWVYDDGEAEG